MTDTAIRPARHQVPFRALAAFFVMAFGLAWGIFAVFIFAPGVAALFGEVSGSHPLFILAVYAPAIAAFGIVLFHGGPAGLGRFLSRLLLWRCSPWWYGFLILGIPLIYVLGSVAKGNLLTGGFPSFTAGQLLAAMAFMLILGPVEEFGWRGLALPLLQRRLAPIWAGLILGLIWGVWHLPAFFLSGTPQSAWGFTPFLIGSVAVSVILTPLFNASRGSILLAGLYHFQLNNPLWPDAQPFDTVFFVAAAVIVVWINRKAMFSGSGAVTQVVP
ncbi:MAG: type II CAAX endopeptidase family protein [Paracoccaceae bacterium]